MINHPNRSKTGTPTEGPYRALRGGDKREWERPGCGFVLGPGDTVVGRFPRYADAVLFSAAPDLLAAALAWVNISNAGDTCNVVNQMRAAITKAQGAK